MVIIFTVHLMNFLSNKLILVITTSTPEKSDGLNALEIAIEKIKETILKLGGHFAIQMAVRRFYKISI